MNEIQNLWNKRVSDYWGMALRYWRLIGNSGLVFTLYILLIAGGYYYHQWLKMLPEAFPTCLVMTLVFSIFTVRSPIRTFLQRADMVFLLPMEGKMTDYFQAALRYSFGLQSVTILVVAVILSPLYFARIHSSAVALLITFLVILGVKWWNLYLSWYEKFISDEKMMRYYTLCRGVVTVIFIYFLFKGVSLYLYVVSVIIMFILLVVFYRPLAVKYTVKWERLVIMDEHMLLLFLRLANLFTDVPSLRDRVKRRSWLNGLTRLVPYNKQSVFKHFFLKTFYRANDYFGIYVRLIVIGGIIEYFVTSPYAKMIFVLLFMYITGLQLLTLWKHELPQALGQLYPISPKVKQQNFIQILFALFVVQSLIYSLISFIGGVWWVLPLSLIFSFGFSFGLAKQRIQKADSSL